MCIRDREWTEFASMFGHLYREKIVAKEQKGKDDRTLYGSEYVWKRNGPDHFAHAFLYAYVGMQRYGGEQARILGQDETMPMGKIVNAEIVTTFSPSDFHSANRVF